MLGNVAESRATALHARVRMLSGMLELAVLVIHLRVTVCVVRGWRCQGTDNEIVQRCSQQQTDSKPQRSWCVGDDTTACCATLSGEGVGRQQHAWNGFGTVHKLSILRMGCEKRDRRVKASECAKMRCKLRPLTWIPIALPCLHTFSTTCVKHNIQIAQAQRWGRAASQRTQNSPISLWCFW